MSLKDYFKGKKVLITVGSTREYFDSVRYLSNASSGKMGMAIAKNLKSFSAKVFLVVGPGVEEPREFSYERVVSARDMLREVKKRFSHCDIFVSCAAVSDFRPNRVTGHKMHRRKASLPLRLISNPDILLQMGRVKDNQFCVGFALEDRGDLQKGFKKMVEKNCNLVVLNTLRSMESEFIEAKILFANRDVWNLGRIKKERCARKLCQAILQSATGRN